MKLDPGQFDLAPWARFIAANADGKVYQFQVEPRVEALDSVDGPVDLWEADDDTYFSCVGRTMPDVLWREQLVDVKGLRRRPVRQHRTASTCA